MTDPAPAQEADEPKPGGARKGGSGAPARRKRGGFLEALAFSTVVQPLSKRMRRAVARPIMKRLAKSRLRLKEMRAELVASREQIAEIRRTLDALQLQSVRREKDAAAAAAETRKQMTQIRAALDSLRVQSAEAGKEAKAMAEIVERSLLTARLRAAPKPAGSPRDAAGG